MENVISENIAMLLIGVVLMSIVIFLVYRLVNGIKKENKELKSIEPRDLDKYLDDIQNKYGIRRKVADDVITTIKNRLDITSRLSKNGLSDEEIAEQKFLNSL